MYYKDGIAFSTHSEIRKSFGNIVLPTILTDEVLATHGVLPEVIPAQPTGDGTISEGPSIFVNDVLTKQWVLTPYTPEELAAQAVAVADGQKLVGIAFTDATDANTGTIMCSATKEDMWGLTSVQTSIAMGGSENFRFDNGNVLVLTPTNADAFMAVWAPFRSSFF